MSKHRMEIETGHRFEFGANWARFLTVLNDDRIRMAETSLQKMLMVENLKDKRFLDIGSGSGLFSLAARRLGARVFSFDYDPQSVACTSELKQRFFPNDPSWVIEEGSVLDSAYLSRLGQFDVVYSWGVLHHTGAMWRALENVVPRVVPAGKLFIAIYNDQGSQSRRWRALKRIYNTIPKFLRQPFTVSVMGARELKFITIALLRGKPMGYVRNVRNYAEHSMRGMSYWHDRIDWIGGYPFEVAKPEDIFSFYRDRGFRLENLKTCAGGLGCNEYVFIRECKDDADDRREPIGDATPLRALQPVARQ